MWCKSHYLFLNFKLLLQTRNGTKLRLGLWLYFNFNTGCCSLRSSFSLSFQISRPILAQKDMIETRTSFQFHNNEMGLLAFLVPFTNRIADRFSCLFIYYNWWIRIPTLSYNVNPLLNPLSQISPPLISPPPPFHGKKVINPPPLKLIILH